MKKNLPTPLVVGIIVACILIVGVIWWACSGAKKDVTTSEGLPPSTGAVAQPPAGWSIDGSGAGPSQPGPQPGN